MKNLDVRAINPMIRHMGARRFDSTLYHEHLLTGYCCTPASGRNKPTACLSANKIYTSCAPVPELYRAL